MVTNAAIFRCAQREVFAEYLGRQRWGVHAASGTARFETNETVGRVLRELLDLVAEPPYNTRAIEVEAPRGVTASIKNNTFPTTLWFYDVRGPLGGEAGAVEPLEAAIWACLVGLALPATEDVTATTPEVDVARFSASTLANSSDTASWAAELSDELSAALSNTRQPGRAAASLIKQLAAAGHVLDSFDKDETFASWFGESTPRNGGNGLVVQAYYAPYQQPTVLVIVRKDSAE